MSVIDQFVFTFSSDAKKVKDGLKDAEDASDSLEKSLQRTDETADKVGAGMADLAKKAGAAMAALFTLNKLKELTKETTDHTFALRNQAATLNMSVSELSKWQQAVKLSGGTAEGATQSITGLHDKFVEMAKFGGNMGPFGVALQSMGISAADMHKGITEPMAVMGKLADVFAKQNQTGQMALGKSLGFDIGTIVLLSQGSRGLQEMMDKQEKLGYVTEKQSYEMSKFKLKLVELNITWETSSRLLVSHLLPALTWVTEKFEWLLGFLDEHQPLVVGFFSAVALGIAAMNAGAVVTAIVMGGMAALFVGIGAAIGFVVDDIWNFIHGGDSLIGRAVSKWPVLGDIFKAIGQIVKMEVDAFKRFFHILGDGVEALGIKWSKFGGIISKVWGIIKEAPIKVLNWIGHHLASLTGGKFDEITNDWNTPGKSSSTSAGGIKSGLEISQKLRSMGWSPEAAAGMAGNIMQESSGNAGAENKGHYGLAQWDVSRQKDFEKWAGHSIVGSSIDEQLAFMTYELTKGKEQKAGNLLKGATSASDAAMIGSKYYERAGSSESNDPRRMAMANDVFSSLSANPLNTTNSNVINSGKSANVQIDHIEVNTQATDGEAVSAAIGKTLNTHIKNALLQTDDGEAG